MSTENQITQSLQDWVEKIGKKSSKEQEENVSYLEDVLKIIASDSEEELEQLLKSKPDNSYSPEEKRKEAIERFKSKKDDL